jgi:hypothetical protein
MKKPVLGLFLLLAQTGCLCWFVPCDRELHVSGHVYDARGKPVRDAEVELYGDTRRTRADGCFRFTGVLAASGFEVTVTKPGFKTYREGKKSYLYDLAIVLQPEDSPGSSTGAWRVLEDSEVPNHEACPDEDEPRIAR